MTLHCRGTWLSTGHVLMSYLVKHSTRLNVVLG